MGSEEILSLKHKIFIVKSYYRYHENEAVVRDELQRNFEIETTNEKIFYIIKNLVHSFESTGSVIEVDCNNDEKLVKEAESFVIEEDIPENESDEQNEKEDILPTENPLVLTEAGPEGQHIKVTTRPKHRNIAEAPYICEICHKIFDKLIYLKKHKRVHADSKQFKCTDCNQGFKWKTVLQKHMKKHLNEDERVRSDCEICGKSLTIESMAAHMKRHSNSRDHTCDVCGKSFVFVFELRQHAEKHKKEKSFSCEICHKKFVFAASLRRHRNLHTGARPFNCEYCEMTFNNSQIRNVHQRIHTGERPFTCQCCAKTFRQQPALIKHMKTHGPDRPRKSNTE